MFEKELSDKLKAIFKLKKVTFDAVSESREQECGFVGISMARGSIREKKQLCRVEGTLTVYGNADKLTYGFFAKRIDEAAQHDKAGFFFLDIEENASMIQNVIERSISFVYFFRGPYDPDVGTLNELTVSEAED